MDNSPLELYERAYGLQYLENKPADARRVYEAIIEEFPDSNECGYAAIQLQKIAANHAGRLAAKSFPSSLHFIAVAALIFALLGLAGMGGAVFFYFQFIDPRLSQLSLLNIAAAKLYAGDEQGALQFLDRCKAVTSTEIAPYSFAAEIYRKNHRFQEARAQFAQYKTMSADTVGADNAIAELTAEEERHNRLHAAQRAAQEQLAQREQEAEQSALTVRPLENKIPPRKEVPVKRRPSPPRLAPAAPQPSAPAQPASTPSPVPAIQGDSISFF